MVDRFLAQWNITIYRDYYRLGKMIEELDTQLSETQALSYSVYDVIETHAHLGAWDRDILAVIPSDAVEFEFSTALVALYSLMRNMKSLTSMNPDDVSKVLKDDSDNIFYLKDSRLFLCVTIASNYDNFFISLGMKDTGCKRHEGIRVFVN